MSPFSRRDVLDALDASADAFDFPCLDNANQLYFSQRMSILRSETCWAIVFESGAMHPAAGISSSGLFLSRHGSAVEGPQGFQHGDIDFLFESHESGRYYLDEHEELVDTDATRILVHGVEVTISTDPDWYSSAGVPLVNPKRPRVIDLFRVLAARHPRLFRAPLTRIHERCRERLAVILELDEWHHPDVAGGEKPSETEAFQQIASVIESGDARCYSPTDRPNTHWSHWPDAGSNTAWWSPAPRARG